MNRNSKRFVVARFLSIMSLFPVEIFITFQLSSSPLYFGLFGATILAGLIARFFFQPILSDVIDRYSRVRIQITAQIISTTFLMSIFLLFNFVGSATPGIYVLIAIVNDLYYMVSYQVQQALAQSVFSRNMYGRLNGINEIMGQLPVVLGAAMTSLVLIFLNFRELILISALFQVVGIIAFWTVRDDFEPAVNPKKGGVHSNYSESYRYLRKNRKPVLFIYLLNFPFIAVVAGNFLKPIFIVRVLAQSSSFLAISESVYAGVAIIAGVIVPLVMERVGGMKTVYICTTIFFVGSLLIPVAPLWYLFLIFQILHGFGNPGTRIARNTVVMKSVPKNEMGRFNGSVQLLTTMTRIVLISVSMLEVLSAGAGTLILVIGTIVFVAEVLAGILLSRNPDVKSYFGISFRGKVEPA